MRGSEVSTSVVKQSVVKVLVIRCLTLLKIYRSYEVAACMVFFSFITLFHNLLFPLFIIVCDCMFCMLLFNFVKYAFLLLCLCILIVIFMYSFCYICSVLCILFHFVVLCTVCVYMCSVLLPPGVNPIAVNKYISYHINIENQYHLA